MNEVPRRDKFFRGGDAQPLTRLRSALEARVPSVRSRVELAQRIHGLVQDLFVAGPQSIERILCPEGHCDTGTVLTAEQQRHALEQLEHLQKGIAASLRDFLGVSWDEYQTLLRSGLDINEAEQ